jgi:hypothetical protein
MPRLLIVSFAYAPMLSARAFRWTAIAEYLAAAGWSVDVVTSWMPGTEPFEERAGVRVHRVSWRWSERLRGALGNARGPAPQAAARLRRPGIIARALQFLRARVWRALYWPDTSCLWYFPARRKALALVREGGHRAMVSVSPTFTGMLVGRAVRAAHPRMRWLLDYGDPFSLQEASPPNNAALYGGLNRRAERAVLAGADVVSVTTQETARRYASAFPETAGRLHVIPPLLSLPEMPPEPLFAADGAERFVFVGTLYGGLREPGFLLDLFEALLSRDPQVRRELHLFGDTLAFADTLAARQRRLGAALQVHGLVPRGTAARATFSADILVNIGNGTRDQLPSKVVEYAAAGKPILNLAHDAQDSSAAFLRHYPAALTVIGADGGPTAGQIDALAGFLASAPRRLQPAEVEAWIAPYRIERIGAQYSELLR